jgi:hypothetical protein
MSTAIQVDGSFSCWPTRLGLRSLRRWLLGCLQHAPRMSQRHSPKIIRGHRDTAPLTWAEMAGIATVKRCLWCD